MDSPVRTISKAILSLIDDIVPNEDEFAENMESEDDLSENDFDSDDLYNDPTFIPPLEEKELEAHTGENVPTDNNEDCLRFNEELRSIPAEYLASSESDGSPHGTKKRARRPELWKSHIRKKLRESGQTYENIKGDVMSKRCLKPPCKTTCLYFCSKNFSSDDRQRIHDSFWKLSDAEKPAFYCKYIKKNNVQRRRQESSIIKKNTFQYYLSTEDDRIQQVCKIFFLNTLSISERRVYYYFKNLHENRCPKPQKRGKNVKKVIPAHQIEGVRNHIESFPTIDSHYCRASSSRKYLESQLSINKMYQLYKEFSNDPVKEHVYRREFNYSFNLSFFKPKKDQCDRCLIFKANENPNTIEKHDFDRHKNEKVSMKAERDLDRKNIDPKHATVCFDLQSVFALPKGNASSFFYKRKLNVYNMTATLILPNKNEKITYCGIWNELQSGRSGDDIASAVSKILHQIVSDNPLIEALTLWSDSCVPQNKNKVMSTALIFFIQNSNLKLITQKFSEPGHSLIQEVDCVHSSIDKYLRNLEIFSQFSLMRHLKNMNFKNVKLKLIQMLPTDFKAFSARAGQLNFSSIPFSKIKFLKYIKDEQFTLYYKTSGREMEYKTASILKKSNKSSLATPKNLFTQSLRVSSNSKPLSKDKINDLKSLFVFMPKVDQNYYEALFKSKT